METDRKRVEPSAMKRPAGLVVFSTLFFFMGFRMMSRNIESVPHVKYIYLSVGIIALLTAWALWTRHADAMKAYWIWLLAWIVGGAAIQLVDQTPLLHIVLWWIFSGAAWVAAGVYLNSALKQRD